MTHRLVRLCALLAVGVAALGCQRRAPGPGECLGFARTLFGIGEQEQMLSFRNKQRFDTVVVLCLTEPFDKKVIRCTEQTQAPLDCLRRYQPEQGKSDQLLPRSSDPSGFEVR